MKTLSGVNMRRAFRLAADLGCDIRNRPGTGETIITHPLFPRPIRVSANRKDCPRSLSTALNHLRRGRPDHVG
jgi:hypothetical protein